MKFAFALYQLILFVADVTRQKAARESLVAEESRDRVYPKQQKSDCAMSRYPGERKYRLCAWCERPLHVWPFQLKLKNSGKFCSRLCYESYRQAVSEALSDGRLEAILAPERARAKAARLRLLQEV